VEQVPIWVDVVSLAKDDFTDGGFRFRKNDLHIKDHILGLESKHIEYIDYEFFNLDSYSKSGWDYSDPKYYELKHRQAELWFRNSDSLIIYTLRIKTFLDLLTSVAGIPHLFIVIIGILLSAI